MVESSLILSGHPCPLPREFCDLPSTANLTQNSKPFRLHHSTALPQSFIGRERCEEDHVAIPTVIHTSNLIYHLKTEKAVSL